MQRAFMISLHLEIDKCFQNKLRYLRLYLLVTAILLIFNPAVHADAGVTAKSIKIGQSITLSGPTDYGLDVQGGISIVLEKINRSGGIHGRRVELITLDDQGNVEKAKSNAYKLLNENGVFALFGSIDGGPSTAIADICEAIQVPFLAPMAGSPNLRIDKRYIFPVRAEHKLEFERILKHASTVGFKRFAFLRSSGAVGEAHLKNVKKISEQLGMEHAADLIIPDKIADDTLDSMVDSMIQNNVQFVFNHGSIGIYEKLIRKLKSGNHKVALYGITSGSSRLAANLGDLAIGMGFTQVTPNPRTGDKLISRQFLSDFKQKFPGKTPSYGAFEGYISALFLTETLKNAGKDLTRSRLLNTLAQQEIFLGDFYISHAKKRYPGSSFIDLSVVGVGGIFRH